ncbi:MAG: LemA family protein [Longimicrobiales bacterium]
MSVTAIIVLVILVGVVVWGISAYNRLVALKNRFENAFAQIDVQLKRRYDLIPNLVETVKGYLSHERETLEAVTQARTRAQQAEQKAAAAPGDPQAMKQLIAAEGALTGALGRLFALQESYPELKASENVRQLQEELTSTENRVAFARQAFNDAVMRYNTARESFPTSIVANAYRFHEAEFFEMPDETHREVPKVSFD